VLIDLAPGKGTIGSEAGGAIDTARTREEAGGPGNGRHTAARTAKIAAAAAAAAAGVPGGETAAGRDGAAGAGAGAGMADEDKGDVCLRVDANTQQDEIPSPHSENARTAPVERERLVRRGGVEEVERRLSLCRDAASLSCLG